MNKDKLVHYSKEKRSEDVEPPAGWDFEGADQPESFSYGWLGSGAELGALIAFGKTRHYRD